MICKTCKYYNEEEDTCDFSREQRISEEIIDECGAYAEKEVLN